VPLTIDVDGNQFVPLLSALQIGYVVPDPTEINLSVEVSKIIDLGEKAVNPILVTEDQVDPTDIL
jgi:hypothetical protein